MNFKILALEWFEGKRKYIKESTATYYMFELQNYILPELGTIENENLTEEVIQETVCKWQTERNQYGRIMKKSTIANLVMLIRQIIRYGIKKQVIHPFNPEIAYLPEIREVKTKTYSNEEQDRIVQAVMSDLSFKSFGILLSLNTGIRIGELCAMQWDGIDIDQNVIKIDNTLQRIYDCSARPRSKIIIGSPKTIHSKRIIPLSEKLQTAIKMMPEINKSGYILTNDTSFMEPRTYRRFYRTFLNKHNIEFLNFHCLRHSFATRLIQNGADYKCVSELLGHANINTTLNMYVHPDISQKRKCIELF